MHDTDARLLAGIRGAAEEFDPMPADLADRMIAALAVADLADEYALLTLVEDAFRAVRGDAETSTLQFSDGTSGLVLHVSGAESGLRRIDGWVNAEADEIRLVQGARSWIVPTDTHGRFVVDDVPPGLCRVQVITAGDGKDLITPQFEV